MLNDRNQKFLHPAFDDLWKGSIVMHSLTPCGDLDEIPRILIQMCGLELLLYRFKIMQATSLSSETRGPPPPPRVSAEPGAQTHQGARLPWSRPPRLGTEPCSPLSFPVRTSTRGFHRGRTALSRVLPTPWTKYTQVLQCCAVQNEYWSIDLY